MNHDAIVEITLVLKSLHDFSRSIIVFNIPNLPFVEVARVRIECTWLTVSGHVLAEEPHASRADGSCFRSLSWDCPHKEDRPWQTCPRLQHGDVCRQRSPAQTQGHVIARLETCLYRVRSYAVPRDAWPEITQ